MFVLKLGNYYGSTQTQEGHGGMPQDNPAYGYDQYSRPQGNHFDVNYQ